MATRIAEPELKNEPGNGTLFHNLHTTESIKGEKPMAITKEKVNYWPTHTERVEISKPTQAIKVGPLVKVVRWLVALHDWLSGDPMTDQERTQANLFRAQHDYRHFPF